MPDFFVDCNTDRKLCHSIKIHKGCFPFILFQGLCDLFWFTQVHHYLLLARANECWGWGLQGSSDNAKCKISYALGWKSTWNL